MRFLFTFLIFSIFSLSNLGASNISSIWYFGRLAGMDFNNPNSEPAMLKDGQIDTYEACATMSDEDGNLLFYTNGKFVWDRNHNIMPGSNNIGHPSLTQIAITPLPGNDSIYYIFTVDYAGNFGEPLGFSCTHINMNLRNGLGGIALKQDTIARIFFTEKIAVTKHANGRDYWVVLHEADNDVFRSYLINENGVDSSYVASQTGSVHTFTDKDRVDAIGYMKISQQGDKLALVKHEDYYLELFDFDPFTGKVSNAKSLYIPDKEDTYTVYGVEFSPDGSKLYASIYKVFWVTDIDKPRTSFSQIFQWDLSDSDYETINNSKKLVVHYDNPEKDHGSFGALQLAPDKKIYVARTDVSNLGVISRPDEIADSCEFDLRGFYLENNICYSGLPNMISGMIFPIARLEYDSTYYIRANNCPESSIYQEIIIVNTGTKSINFDFENIAFSDSRFNIESLNGNSILMPQDSLSLLVNFNPRYDDRGIFRDTLLLNHIDTAYLPKNPLSFEFIIELDNIQTAFYAPDKSVKIDSLFLGCISVNDTAVTSVPVKNLSDADISFLRVEINNEYFSANLIDTLVNKDDFGEIEINFIPEQIGKFYAELYLYAEECIEPIDTLILSGEAAYDYTLNKSEIDFGLISECDFAIDTLVFTNISKNPIVIQSIEIIDDNDAFYSDDAIYPHTVEANDIHMIIVKYNPTDKGHIDKATLNILTELNHNNELNIALTGESDTLNLNYLKKIDFGDIYVNQTVSQTFYIVNNGALERTINHSFSDKIVYLNLNNKVLYPDEVTSFEITIHPLVPGEYNGIVSIIFNQPCKDTVVFNIRARVLNSLVVTPSEINFDSVSFCNISNKSFTMKNEGNTDLSIDSLYLKDGNNFSIQDNIKFPLQLNQNSEHEIELIFDYDIADYGDNTDSLVIVYSSGEYDYEILIYVYAFKSAIDIFTDFDANFPNTVTGSESKQEFSIDNIGNNDVYISKYNLPDGFYISDEILNIRIPGNQTFNFTVIFAPQNFGNYSGSMEIYFTDNICEKKNIYELTGETTASIVFEIEDATGDIGQENFSIDVWAYINSSGAKVDDIEYSMQIELASDFFYMQNIIGEAAIESVEFYDMKQNITITGTIEHLSNKREKIFSLRGILLSSRDDSASVDFVDIELEKNLLIESNSGMIYNTSSCNKNFPKIIYKPETELSIIEYANDISIQFQNAGEGYANLKVYNLRGICVFSNEYFISSPNELIELRDFNSGIYLLQIEFRNRIFRDKFIISK